MSVRTVQPTAQNVGADSFLHELAGIVNGLAAYVNTVTGDALFSDPGLAIGTDKTKVLHDALLYQVDGVRHYIATGEVAFTATTHDIADPDTDPREAIYVLSAGHSETVTITKGDDAADGEAVAPATPADHVKFGEVLIQHNGSAIFNASTDELDAAHLTVTYTDEEEVEVTPPDIDTIAFANGVTPD